MLFRTYLDPRLYYAVSLDGTWSRPIEAVMGNNRKAIYDFWVYNSTPRTATFELTPPALEHFSVSLPATVEAKPGPNRVTMRIECIRPHAPVTEDFTVRYHKPQATESLIYDYAGRGGKDYSFASWDAYAAGVGAPGEDEFRVEVTAFFLETGDARYPGVLGSVMDSPERLAEHVGSGAGWIPIEFQEGDITALTRLAYPHALWALNKRLYLNPLYGPLRVAPNRADALSYRPPGLGLYPPNIRRAVLAKAAHLSAAIGTRYAIVEAFTTLGLDVREVQVEHNITEHIWHIRIPRRAISFFSGDFLGQFALYHVDGYEGVLLEVLDDNKRYLYTQIDYTNLAFVG